MIVEASPFVEAVVAAIKSNKTVVSLLGGDFVFSREPVAPPESYVAVTHCEQRGLDDTNIELIFTIGIRAKEKSRSLMGAIATECELVLTAAPLRVEDWSATPLRVLLVSVFRNSDFTFGGTLRVRTVVTKVVSP